MIALACDHAALEMKREIIGLLDDMGLAYKDFGTYEAVSCHYPLYGERAARAVASGECDRGILICGTGIGMSLVANKVAGIRCVVCSEPVFGAAVPDAQRHQHAGAGRRVVGTELAKMIARIWLETAFEGGRHQNRVDMITAIEQGGTAQDA